MSILCFDISSSGIAAALFNSEVGLLKFHKVEWPFALGVPGTTGLSVDLAVEQFQRVLREIGITEPLNSICIGSFMHNCVLLNGADRPLTPLLTWLDSPNEDGMAYVKQQVGDRFFEMTGCRYHPMYPIFKLAAICQRDGAVIEATKRVASIKTFLVHRLTATWIEDHGMASASGLCNLISSDWDPELLEVVGLNPEQMPPISNRHHVAGHVTREAASEFGLAEGIAVINGSGDGFLAHLGSGYETSERISVTLGTSAVARCTVSTPLLDEASGTFCYRASENAYLLGCAGSNGGNVLGWGRSIFGDLKSETAQDIPIFIPLLHGERTPEWNPRMTGSWHGLKSRHTAADLARSIVEGVMFNLSYFLEILQRTSGFKAHEIILSGHGFLHPLTAPILATLAGVPVLMPSDPGILSLRGAAICAVRAFGSAAPSLKTIPVSPLGEEGILERYERFKELRS